MKRIMLLVAILIVGFTVGFVGVGILATEKADADSITTSTSMLHPLTFGKTTPAPETTVLVTTLTSTATASR